MEKIWETHTEAETRALAEQLARQAQPGDIFCLSGDLGVGKTVFAQGFARGLAIPDSEYIASPTFAIVNVYEEGRLPLYHFDVYRIGDADEMEDTGYEQYFFGQGVCLVEWAALIAELIPPTAQWITIEKDLSRGTDYRKITLRGGNL